MCNPILIESVRGHRFFFLKYSARSLRRYCTAISTLVILNRLLD